MDRSAGAPARYIRATRNVFAWLEERTTTLERIEPVIVAAYIEQLGQTKSAPTV